MKKKEVKSTDIKVMHNSFNHNNKTNITEEIAGQINASL